MGREFCRVPSLREHMEVRVRKFGNKHLSPSRRVRAYPKGDRGRISSNSFKHFGPQPKAPIGKGRSLVDHGAVQVELDRTWGTGAANGS